MMQRLRHTWNPFVWLMLASLILLGCIGPGKRLEPLRITLTHIQVQEIKVFETVFEIELRLFNSNDIAVEIKGLDCEVELNDMHFASGISNKETTIPPYDTATIPVTIYSSVLDLVKTLIDSGTKEKMQYRLKGRLHLSGDTKLPSAIPFETEGELSLPEPMRTRAEKIGARGSCAHCPDG
jgi:LEA14-like dessication related protein